MAISLVTWALCTLAEIKEYLGIPTATTTWDDLLRRLINSASSFIEKETDRRLVATAYDKDVTDDRENTWFDGLGNKSLHLRQYPINSVTQCQVSGATISAAGSTDYYGSTGYVIRKRRGTLYYANGFDIGIQNCRVSYNAGYAAGTPEREELRELVCSLVGWTFNNRKHLGFKSERIGNYAYSRGDLREAWQLTTILRYRRKTVA